MRVLDDIEGLVEPGGLAVGNDMTADERIAELQIPVIRGHRQGGSSDDGMHPVLGSSGHKVGTQATEDVATLIGDYGA